MMMTRFAHMILLAPVVMAGLTVRAQTTDKEALARLFARYQSAGYQEKVFVHVDRSFYLAGETIWFKVYDVAESSNKPSTLSGTAYVEVLGSNQKPFLQARIDMADGKGNGSFQLPASFPSGNYILRAYTAWMKNFTPDLYYSQPLTVINTLAQPIPFGRPDTIIRRREAIDVRFFPEGGNLVAGLSSRVGFKGVSSDGKGVNCKGAIVDQNKDTVARFGSARFGMGSFLFTPLKGDSYEAIVTTGDSTFRVGLPPIYEQGFVMAVTDAGESQVGDAGERQVTDAGSSRTSDAGRDKLRVTLHTNMSIGNQTVYLFAQTRDAVKGVWEGFVSNGVANFLIDKAALGDGITQFTFFNAGRTPLCQRLFFKQPAGRMHIDAVLAGTGYGTRRRVDMDLTTTNLAGQPVKGDLSLAVFQVDSLQELPQENILTWLLLTGDLKGRIESPRYYFEHTGPEVTEALDNLMLTQGWTRFRWEDVLQSRTPAITFLPEPDGHVITGKVIDKRTGLPAPPVTGYLSIPGRHFAFCTSLSRQNGDIRFHVKKFFGNSEVIVQTNSQTADSNYRIDIANPFSEEYAAMHLPDLQFPDKWKNALLYRHINAQVENTYRIALKHRLAAEREDTLPFYGSPDLHYNLDDYTRFVTLEEVIREYVLDVHLKEQSGRYDFRIRNSLFNNFFEDAPLVLLDGMPVFDATRVVNMDPLKVRAVEVVTHKFYTNSAISDGILSYQTYDGDLAGYPPDPNAVAVQYSGLQQEREFYTPVYDQPAQVNSPIPDLRNLLLWDPRVQTDDQGRRKISLYTSDLPGTFVVVLQGLTAEGFPGCAVRTFTVSK